MGAAATAWSFQHSRTWAFKERVMTREESNLRFLTGLWTREVKEGCTIHLCSLKLNISNTPLLKIHITYSHRQEMSYAKSTLMCIPL